MEILYNGIKLPDVWPPRDIDQNSDRPMPVPYLNNPPEMICINTGRQLFVDDFLIEKTNLSRLFHKPAKYINNPILFPNTKHETDSFASVGFLQGGVFYNPMKKYFEMFYHAGHLVESRSLHYAISKDMINWEKIDVGLGRGNMFLQPGAWSGYTRQNAGTAFAVWLDLDTEYPDERYKMLSFWGHKQPRPPSGMTHSLHVSKDGIYWSDAVLARFAEDAQSLIYNPFRKVWIYSLKRHLFENGHQIRARWYKESKDFLSGYNWDDAVYWTRADNLDKPEPKDGYPAYPFHGEQCQLYILHGVAYESIMLGMHEIYRGPENDICEEGKFPKLVDLEIGYSRDGFHWHRPDRTGFIKGSRRWGTWDMAYLHSTTSICVVLEDELVFPYAAFSGVDPMNGSKGRYNGGSIGIATLRRDGFASLYSETEGFMLTRQLIFSGEYLFVNIDNIAGSLLVEICSYDGTPFEGYSKEDCLPVSENCTKKLIQWKNGRSLKVFKNKPVRFRFYLSEGDLYSFWVSKTIQGRSGGYLAGGSPGDAGIRDE